MDVHARSVVACAIDGQTGEVHRARLCPDTSEITRWVQGLPAPARVVYEAGPTGFGLARGLAAAGIECVVAAPSKLPRPAGDRVKTDAGTPCCWPGCCGWGRSRRCRCRLWSRRPLGTWCGPREDVRGDLMRARHRLSKLLLRHGVVYSGGT